MLLLAACRNPDPEVTVVTEVVQIEGEERVVTKVVRQTVAVTVTPNAQAPPERYQPVQLDISFVGGIPNIDPQTTDDPDGIDLVENLFVGLTRFDSASNTVEAALAAGWEVTPDGRTWTFHLRDDVFWVKPLDASEATDGTWDVEPVRPVIAADVVYGIQRACQRATGTPDAFVLYLIDGCEQLHLATEPDASALGIIAARAVDDTTLEIHLKQPASQFLAITSMWIMRPVPQELVEGEEADWQMSRNLITSGPFLLAPGSLANNRPLLYRNPMWPLPRPGNVDRVSIAILNDELQAYQLWQAKRLDTSPLPATERDLFLNELPERAILVTDPTVFYLGFNLNSGVLREANVRRALNAAIDRELLVDELYGGRAIGVKHITPPGVFGGLPVDEIGKGYDPDFARQQMATSGFRSCRLMPAITYLVSTSDLSLQQAQLIRQMWVDELGCTEEQIVIEQVQFGTLLANTRQEAGAERPDIWELGWASYFPDPYNWVGDLLHCVHSENRQGRPCSEVDELIDQAVAEGDQDQRQLLYRRIEELFFGAEGIEPVAPLYVPGDYVLVQSWLTYQPTLFGGERYDSYIIASDLKRLEQSRGQ